MSLNVYLKFIFTFFSKVCHWAATSLSNEELNMRPPDHELQLAPNFFCTLAKSSNSRPKFEVNDDILPAIYYDLFMMIYLKKFVAYSDVIL